MKNAPAHTHHKAGTRGQPVRRLPHADDRVCADARARDHSMRPPMPARPRWPIDRPTPAISATPTKTPPGRTNRCANGARATTRSRSLERAALIAAARKGDWTKLPDMLAYLSPAQPRRNPDRLAGAAAGQLSDDAKWPGLRKLPNDPSPLVRASAAEALGGRLDRANAEALLRAAGDDYRLVRVRAASRPGRRAARNVSGGPSSPGAAAMAELLDSLKSRPDDMGSHYNLGNFHMARGQMRPPSRSSRRRRACSRGPAAVRERRAGLQRAGPKRQGRGQPPPRAPPRSHQRRRQFEPRHAAGRNGQDARGRTGLPRRVQVRPAIRPGGLQPRRVVGKGSPRGGAGVVPPRRDVGTRTIRNTAIPMRFYLHQQADSTRP